jgi:hypothetical protein
MIATPPNLVKKIIDMQARGTESSGGCCQLDEEISRKRPLIINCESV